MKIPWWAIAGGLAGSLLLFRRRGGSYSIPANIAKEKITNSTLTDDGWIMARPADLAAQAGMDVEAYTLARFIGSEFGSGNPTEKVSIAWAILNTARRRRWSLLKLATETTRFGNQGYYGSQEHGRFASTSRDPSEEDAYVAGQVLFGVWPDPTQGATKFFDPSAQTALHERKPTLYRTADEVIAKWLSEGSRLVSVPGTRTEKLLLFA